MSASRYSAPILVARGAALVLAGLVVSRLLNYAWRIALARGGGIDEFGVLFIAIATIAAAGSLAGLGVDLGVARFIPLYLGREDKASLRASLRWSLLFSLGSGCAMGLLIYLTAPVLAIRIFHNPELAPILKLCSVCLPFFVAGRVLIKAAAGFQKISYRVGVYQVFNPVLKLALTLVLLSAGMGAAGALWSYLAAEGVSAVALWAILERRVFGMFSGSVEKAVSTFNPRQFLVYSFPLFLAGTIDLLMNYTDTFMTGYYLDSVQVGLYGAAVTLASLVVLGTELLNPLFLSIITRDFAAGDTRSVVAAYNNNNRWILYFSLPVALFTVIMSREMMVFLWGDAFEAGAITLMLLCTGRFLFSLENTSLQILSMHGAGTFLWISNLSVALINVGLNFRLIPLIGIEGAALATALSLSLHACLVIGWARILHRGQGMRIFFPRIIASGLIPAAGCYALKGRLGTGWVELLLTGVVFMALFGFSLKLLRVFSAEDLMVWRAILRRLRISGI